MKTEYDFSKGERGRFFREGAEINLPASDVKPDWKGPEGPLGKFIVEECEKTLASYCAQSILIIEHANHERDTAHGGYAHRQLFELAQNSADALLGAPKGKSILIRLTADFLYCADDGTPIDERGVEGLMFSHMSSKQGTGASGRFGLGFKSVLKVTDAPEFFSRSGSFRFDRARAKERIAQKVAAPAKHYPVLRLPESIDPHKERDADEDLHELMSWATNIVRLPLKAGAHEDLAQQIEDFPPEFLLFVNHIRYLTLEDGERSRNFMLRNRNDELHLDTGERTARWRVFKKSHPLSIDARNDWPLHDDSGDAPIRWAAPLDRLDRPGHFWALFPTSTASLVAGILNAPWKTNEDRQNLLPSSYNEELIEAAAEMIAKALPKLATNEDPARHLDALPRRREAGDTDQADLLRTRLFSHLHGRAIVPDQDGNPRAHQDISYPPDKLTRDGQGAAAACEHWTAYPGRPSNWLHHTALTPNRLAIVDRLFHPEGEPPRGPSSGAPRATIAEWLKALVEGKEADEAVRASIAAVQTAAAIPPETRSGKNLGKIVLTADGAWRAPDPEHLFLPDETETDSGSTGAESYVHPDLASDSDTLSALKALEIKPPSPKSRFRLVAKRILKGGSSREPDGDLLSEFWALSRRLTSEHAFTIVHEFKDWITDREIWPTKLRVRTLAGNWQPLHSVLLPGAIVPGDGSRDSDATVDTDFHDQDDDLLQAFGVTKAPHDDRNLSLEPQFESYRRSCRKQYYERDDLPRKPHRDKLDFASPEGVGPLEVLAVLSAEGKALYTDALLNLDASYKQWTMRHTGSNRRTPYPEVQYESLTIHMLRKHGGIRTPSGIAPLADALAYPTLAYPKSSDALDALLRHAKADRIKEVFDMKEVFNLAEPTPEFFGEEEPIPLIEVWPGLKQYLQQHLRACRLVRCERIRVLDKPIRCVFRDPDIYLSEATEPSGDDLEALLNYYLGRNNRRHELQLVTDELKLDLATKEIEAILHFAIRQRKTDPERLLEAVGEQALREGLPNSFLAVLEKDGAELTGIEIAEATIEAYHTDALRQYKWALDCLGPPPKWAGSRKAVEFVTSLGFSPEWAGERNRTRDPFLEVEGPYSLPDLHDYQRTIANNVRTLLRGEYGAERRGMISMPTGSGKTRVAVQAIVEAMREDGFRGGVLWVADRGELCEQAVEAWRQVWSSEGTQAKRLRISRMWHKMWHNKPPPSPTNEPHVVVATIQTLHTRLSKQSNEYEFLADFKLIVFDEAHRSTAPIFTSVMEKIGLTRFRRADGPFMLGLTATPYRGHNKDETARLVNRYGRKRLDMGAFGSDDAQNVIQELQSMGVLAQADHETIKGETFSFDPDELARILEAFERESSLPWLPQHVEDRIAGSAERTKRIVEAYGEHIKPDWPTLIFATSVEHAHTVATLLNLKGIRSFAVSGETGTATRRRVVEEFRLGDIQALVNYGVFREGFDAPRTRAIIVARPVYSPNLYFQMIGRGLRGPLNGGNERCLILNVEDNIENFNRVLAFSELDWLWA